MKKRFLTKKPNLITATNEELFTELMNRVEQKSKCNCFFIDKSYTNFVRWELHDVNKHIVETIK